MSQNSKSLSTPESSTSLTSESVIQVHNLTKKFGKLVAVDDLTFKVNKGKAVALWGANGAGKTTVLRCLLGVMPFEGNIVINGIDVLKQSKSARRMVGFVPQEINFHDDMSIRETMQFYTRLKKSDFRAIDVWLNRVGLEMHTAKKVGELSGGLKQRLALAIALLANPRIIFLDEPTTNLDVQSRIEFLNLLIELKAEGKTIIFASHRLEEINAFADQVLVLEQGRLVTDCPPAEVYKHISQSSFLRLFIPQDQLQSAVDILNRHNFQATRNGNTLSVQISANAKVEPITILINSDIQVKDFEYELLNHGKR